MTPLLLLLCLGTAVHAEPNAYDSTRFSFEFGIRGESFSGTMMDKEKANYKYVGLGLEDKDGNVSEINPQGMSGGIDLGVYLRLHSTFEVGIAFEAFSTSVQPEGVTDENMKADLMKSQAVVLRGRFQPINLGALRLGAEVGLGAGFGSVTRFALAAKNRTFIYNSFMDDYTLSNPRLVAEFADSYIATGNEPIDISGMRFEFALLATRYFMPHLGFNVRLGFQYTSWSVSGTDPLTQSGYDFPAYPTKVPGYGVTVASGIFGAF